MVTGCVSPTSGIKSDPIVALGQLDRERIQAQIGADAAALDRRREPSRPLVEVTVERVAVDGDTNKSLYKVTGGIDVNGRGGRGVG